LLKNDQQGKSASERLVWFFRVLLLVGMTTSPNLDLTDVGRILLENVRSASDIDKYICTNFTKH
jgi:hypothetical protein